MNIAVGNIFCYKKNHFGEVSNVGGVSMLNLPRDAWPDAVVHAGKGRVVAVYLRAATPSAIPPDRLLCLVGRKPPVLPSGCVIRRIARWDNRSTPFRRVFQRLDKLKEVLGTITVPLVSHGETQVELLSLIERARFILFALICAAPESQRLQVFEILLPPETAHSLFVAIGVAIPQLVDEIHRELEI
jgi:hypothetical protein